MKDYYNINDLYVGTIEYISNVTPFEAIVKQMDTKFIFEKVEISNNDSDIKYKEITNKYREIFTENFIPESIGNVKYVNIPYLVSTDSILKYYPNLIDNEISKQDILLLFDEVNNKRINKGPVKRKRK